MKPDLSILYLCGCSRCGHLLPENPEGLHVNTDTEYGLDFVCKSCIPHIIKVSADGFLLENNHGHYSSSLN